MGYNGDIKGFANTMEGPGIQFYAAGEVDEKKENKLSTDQEQVFANGNIKSERKDGPSGIKNKIFNIILDHCVGSDGSFSSFNTVFADDNTHEILWRLLDVDGSDLPELFLENANNADRLIVSIEKMSKNNFLKKIKALYLLSEMYGYIVDTGAVADGDKIIKFLQDLQENKDEEYFVTVFAKTLLGRCERVKNWETGKSISTDITKEHEEKFDAIKFDFSFDMLEKINRESREYADKYRSPVSSKNNDVWPIQDYITQEIAPGIVGAFAMDGELLAWQNFNSEKLGLLENFIENMKGDGNTEGALDDAYQNYLSGDMPGDDAQVFFAEKDYLLHSFEDIKNEVALKEPDDIFMFKLLFSISFRKLVEMDFNISLSKFDLRTQYQFLQFIKDSGPAKINDVRKFVGISDNKNSNQYRFKAFLSLEHGGQEMGKKILEIGEKFNQTTADTVFAKYAELVGYAQKSGEYLTEKFSINDKNNAQKIAEQLLQRGKALLALCADEDLTPEQIYQKLEDIKGEVEIFTVTLKSAKDDGIKIDFEMVKDLRIEKKVMTARNDLTQEEKDNLIKICTDNYKDIFAKNPEAYERVVKDFRAEIDNLEGQMVYVMKYQNKIIAFCRFAPLSEQEVYGGSLNVSKNVQGLSVGNYFIKSTLDEVSNQYDIRIRTRKDNPANNNYQKKGFLVMGETKADDGVEYYNMLLPAKNQLQKAT